MKHKAHTLAAVVLAFAFASSCALSTAALSNIFPWNRRDPGASSSSSSSAEEDFEIELGSYQSTMTVGTTQKLSPIVTPADGSYSLSLMSENNNVVAVGEQGYIGAVGAGSTRVALTCTAASGKSVTVYYDITVEPVKIAVTSIALDAPSTSLQPGESTSLNISITPSNAITEVSDITFTTSNKGVVTVSDFGKVTAVAAGKATVTVSAGGVSRSITFTVTVPTEGIRLNSSYLVLKPGEVFQLSGKVSPASAPQRLSFSSLNKSVASVNSSGLVTAVGLGSTSILVSNGASQAAVTVIVNRVTDSSPTDTPDTPDQPQDTPDRELSLLEKIRNAAPGELLTAAEADLPTVTTEMLNALYLSRSSLCVMSDDGYVLTIRGTDIRNAGNALNTHVVLTSTEEGLELVLNYGENLPGKITVELDPALCDKYNYVYLFNRSQERWQMLDAYSRDDHALTLDVAGTYRLQTNKITWVTMNLIMVAGALLGFVGVVLAYIFTKKRYWFW